MKGLYSIFILCLSPLLLAQEQINKNDLSYVLLDLETNKIIEKKSLNQKMTLASVSKLFTSFYALSILDSQYRFKTKVYARGLIKDNVLKGDLYLQGGGDPYLTAPHLISLIHQIVNKGINKVEGNFYYLDHKYASSKKISLLGQEDQADNPAMGALNVEFNRFKVMAKGRFLHPPLDQYVLKRERTTSNGQKFSLIKSENQTEIWQANLKEDLDYKEELPTRDSSLFTSSLFSFLANKHGLKLNTAQKIKTMPKDSYLIATHQGLNLERLVALSLEYSNNLIAEILLKTAAQNNLAKTVKTDEATKMMYQWYKRRFKELPWDQADFINGSGLTLKNKITPKLMTMFLKKVETTQFNKRSFWSYLSINAHSGGIFNRLYDKDMAYSVYGKTGSLYFVNNLAGYIITHKNKKMAYAIFHTSHEQRKKLNKAKNPKQLIKQSKKWNQNSNRIQDNLLKTWVRNY